MKTIYLIQSSDYISIKESINTILSDNNLTLDNLIRYDLNESNLDNVLEDLDTYNFLVDRKVVVVDNISFLTTAKSKNDSLDEIDKFTKYLNNPSSENILIVLCSNLDGKKGIVKLLKEKAVIIESDISINKIIKKRLDGFNMDDCVINYFIEYCGHDNEKILNELEKLKCYKEDDKTILYDDIDSIVLKSFSDNVFSLIDAIMNKNRKKAISLYQELLKNGEDVNKILSLLCDQFRMIYNGKILLKEHNNNYKEVADVLDIHPYRLQKSIESSFNYSNKDILYYLGLLEDIEIGIKTGKNTISSLEVFIFSL